MNDKVDRWISVAYRERCSGIQIAMSDIELIFAVGREAYARGVQMKMGVAELRVYVSDAVFDFVQKVRKN
jgi:hypothetical protein